eukprot:TRINITY_DN1223_c0_g1_i6.p1 TRINITY_DN1223_c0_g1~~TRINITY_DN1223_c0_g1_i6.p1  ORF type:complete len:209 (+),score=-23.48 TRINITY_DN1223_c0_g1_i6:676-1302(+)
MVYTKLILIDKDRQAVQTYRIDIYYTHYITTKLQNILKLDHTQQALVFNIISSFGYYFGMAFLIGELNFFTMPINNKQISIFKQIQYTQTLIYQVRYICFINIPYCKFQCIVFVTMGMYITYPFSLKNEHQRRWTCNLPNYKRICRVVVIQYQLPKQKTTIIHRQKNLCSRLNFILQTKMYVKRSNSKQQNIKQVSLKQVKRKIQSFN